MIFCYSNNAIPTIAQMEEGVVFLIDKPLGWTSFDVVNKLRSHLKRFTNNKKLKVGHAGTLDPLATGLLIVCVGKATKRIDEFMTAQKGYSGTIRLGATTPSYDAETAPDQFFNIDHLNPDFLASKVPLFLGELQQLPPVFSAIKIDGKPLYKAAHQGKSEEVVEKIQARSIQIYDFKIHNFQLNQLVTQQVTEGGGEESETLNLVETDFEVQCSKGTYIRSLAYDFGKACDSGAYLSRLCRTSIGEFELKNAWQLTDLLQKIHI